VTSLRQASRMRPVLAQIAALLVCIATGGTSLAPPLVDTAMVERTLAGAEWLAAQAGTLPDAAGLAEAEDLVGWLMAVRRALPAGRGAFSDHLAGNGYGQPLLAAQRWLEEFSRVEAAAESASRATNLRPPREIMEELTSLPTVPLDEAGEVERNRLQDELALAGIPETSRKAGAAALARLAALRRIAGLDGAN